MSEAADLAVPSPDTLSAAELLALTDGVAARAGAMRRDPRRQAKPATPWRYLQLWPAGTAPDAPMAVRLIGVNEPHSLIVGAPRTATGGLAFVKEGSEFEFRGFSGESIHHFTAVIQKVRFEPYPYLHVGWPQAWRVETRKVRSSRRISCRLPCIVYPTRTRQRFVHGHLVDLSATGAAIEVIEPWPENADELHLAFRLEIAGSMFLAGIDGQRVGHDAPGGDLRVKFVDLTETARLALNAYVNAELVRDLETPLYARGRSHDGRGAAT